MSKALSSDVTQRYDEFQSRAVRNVVGDFQSEPNGRFLLVIPTGGGKTYTAVKSVCELFERGILSKETDSVLWVAHRIELVEQASTTFERWFEDHQVDLKLGESILVQMIDAGTKTLSSNSSIKLVVIDEAHHAAAKTYLPLFSKKDVGVLGLTATPSRHDGLPLEFQRESFSIGFPDLVKMGVILRPTIRTIDGIESDLTDMSSSDQLNKLDDEIRNQRIIDGILENVDDYRKVVVFVGTKEHVLSLHRQMLDSKLTDHYPSITYVTGEKNSRGVDRADYVEAEKLEERSIIVNVQVLTEGYDDPSINTVVMATPSKSKLYYMQALGRAIRHQPGHDDKKAYVLEVEDQLPNIRYRINNRWLFSDISDALEPAVIDRTYRDEDDFIDELRQLAADFYIPDGFLEDIRFDDAHRYSVLLFKKYVAENTFHHEALLLTNENRTRVSNAFNYISERAQTYINKRYGAVSVFETLRNNIDPTPFEHVGDRVVFDAVTNAAKLIALGEDAPGFVKEGAADNAAWITFCAFQQHTLENEIEDDLLEFIRDMINREDVLRRLELRDYGDTDCLIKLPLPLCGYHGLFVSTSTQQVLERIVSDLMCIGSAGSVDQYKEVSELEASSVLPIEMKYFRSLVLIARDGLKFFYRLER